MFHFHGKYTLTHKSSVKNQIQTLSIQLQLGKQAWHHTCVIGNLCWEVTFTSNRVLEVLLGSTSTTYPCHSLISFCLLGFDLNFFLPLSHRSSFYPSMKSPTSSNLHLSHGLQNSKSHLLSFEALPVVTWDGNRIFVLAHCTLHEHYRSNLAMVVR